MQYTHRLIFFIIAFALISQSCNSQRKYYRKSTQRHTVIHKDTANKQLTTAQYLESLGMINIKEKDPSIHVHLMYATTANFTGQLLYNDLKEAYLHPKAAKAILKAQQLLKRDNPQYSLIIYDAARPMSIQQKMWDVVKHTSKQIYISNPAHGGGLHNYGLAVDISIVDKNGKMIDMGTPVDYMGYQSHIRNEYQLAQKGIISKQAYHNRQLLRNVMTRSGFHTLATEWWHFNYCSRKVARRNYSIIK
jgi:D-alanyl-D-alanine dipeptidase